MAEYNDIISFGGIFFKKINITASEKQSTLKTNIGKNFVEKSIFARNKNDTVLQITGIIDGLSQTSAQTRATAIQNDRASLIVLDDGFKHSYNDGKHNTEFVIQKGSLVWQDPSNRENGEPNRFQMTIIEW